MEVFGVMSICCAKAIPAGRPSNRTEIAPTQPTLEITCRARTVRILTAGFRSLARRVASPAARVDRLPESESRFSKHAFRKLRGAHGPESDAGAGASRPHRHPGLPRGLRARHRHGVFGGGGGEPLLLQLPPAAPRPARLRGRGPGRGWTGAAVEDAHLRLRHPQRGPGPSRGPRRDAPPDEAV